MWRIGEHWGFSTFWGGSWRYDGVLDVADFERSRVTFCEGREAGLKNSYVSFRRTAMPSKHALGRRASQRRSQEAGALGWALSAGGQAGFVEAQQLVDRHVEHLGVAGE